MAVKPEAAGKERILDAAQQLFSGAAFAEVGVSQILERSKTGAPTLYHHFGDKEGLFVAWAESAFRRVGEVLASPQRGQSARDRLVAYALALLSGLDFDLGQTLRDAAHCARPESQERLIVAYNQSIYEPLVGLLVQGIADGQIMNESVAPMADAFLGGLLSLRRPGAPQGIAAETASWWCEAFLRAFGSGSWEPRLG